MASDITVFNKLRGLPVSFKKLEGYFNIKIKSMDHDIFSDLFDFSMCCDHKEEFICSTEHELVSFKKLEGYFNIKIKSMDHDIFTDPFSMCCDHKEEFICSTEHELAVLCQQPACGYMYTVHKCVDEPSAVEFQHKNKCPEDHYEVMDFKYRDVDIGLGSGCPHDGNTFKENIDNDKKHTEIVSNCSELIGGNPYWKKRNRIGIQSKAKNNVSAPVGQKDTREPRVIFDPGSDDVSESAYFSQSSMISVRFIFSFYFIACFIGSCWGATPIWPTQKLPESCLQKMADEQYDCPAFQNMNEIGTTFQNLYLELNNTCCAGFTHGYDFHCQEVLNNDGVSHSMFGCMNSEWVPSDCTGRIKNYSTFNPYFEVEKIPPTHYHREGRYSYLVRFPEHAHEKSKCTDYGMEKFCHGLDSNNMCTCRKGFFPYPGNNFAFNDDMIDNCRIKECLQGLCPTRHFPPDYTGPDMDCNKIDLSSDLYNFTCEKCPVILSNSTEQPKHLSSDLYNFTCEPCPVILSNSTEQPKHLSSDLYNFTCEPCPVILSNSTEQSKHDPSSLIGTGITHKDLGFDLWRAVFLLLILGFVAILLVIAKFWDSIKEKIASIYQRRYNFIQQDMNTV